MTKVCLPFNIKWNSPIETDVFPHSSVHLAKGKHCGTLVENAVYGTFLGICQPEIQSVFSEMGQWTPELCFGLSQVCEESIVDFDES